MLIEPTVTIADRDVLDLRLAGSRVTRYHFGAHLARPYLAPLVGPGGRDMTCEPGPPDHPHHRGVWVGHRDAGGVDHWTELPGHGRIAHRGFDELGPAVRELLEWLAPDGRATVAEERVLHLAPGPTLDLTVRLRALEGPVTLGEAKDAGLIAVRVAPWMDTIENAEGARGEHGCRGHRAAWCDFSGSDGGIAILDHPANPRYPAPWHVRDYGLMAPNPFLDNGSLRLDPRRAVSFRYRLIVHEGDAAAGRIADRWSEFAGAGR